VTTLLFFPFIIFRSTNDHDKQMRKAWRFCDSIFRKAIEARALRLDSADLHSELCDQIAFRVRAETWAPRNFNSAVDYRHGFGERSRAKIGKHPLERRNFVLCREAMQHR
jgi:hypothetical protein